MTLTTNHRRWLIAGFSALLLIVYGISWLSPSIGTYYVDAIYLVTAKAIAAGHGYVIDSLPVPVAQTLYPPLFPGLLALFTLVAQQAQWLKLLPIACTLGWLTLTHKLLMKMGASCDGALVMVAITAACPGIVSLATNLFPASLFAILITAAFLALLNDRALLAGFCAGLATITIPTGIPFIVAGIFTLAVRRRFRSAILFTAVAIVIAAPWFGWSLAHAPHVSDGSRLSDRMMIIGRNAILLLESPFSLMSGVNTLYAGTAVVVLFVWSLIKRRQLVPDLFAALYCLMLICQAAPPERFVAPILPLLLWMLWRVFASVKNREAFAAVVLIFLLLPLGMNLRRPASPDWSQMQKMFGWLRANTPADTVVLAELDPLFYLNTGRKTTRGFTLEAPTPDALSNAIMSEGVGYVAVTPERDPFHKSVDALERGGLLEPVPVPDLKPGYRILKTASFRLR